MLRSWAKNITFPPTTWRTESHVGSETKLKYECIQYLHKHEYVLCPQEVLSNKLTPCSRVLFEELIVPELVKKFPKFYGIRSIIAFAVSHHLFIYWARSNHSTPKLFLEYFNILPSTPRSSKSVFPSYLPTATLYAPLQSPIRTTHPAHLILLYLITRIIFGEEYRS